MRVALLALLLFAAPAWAQTDAEIKAQLTAFAQPSRDPCFAGAASNATLIVPIDLSGAGWVRDNHGGTSPDYMYSSLWFFAASGCWGDGVPFPNARPLNVEMRTALRSVVYLGTAYPAGTRWMKYTRPRAPCPGEDDGGYGCPYVSYVLWSVPSGPPPPPPVVSMCWDEFSGWGKCR